MENSTYANRTIVALLASVGLSNIGEWIYFIALNITILSSGGTAFSVGVLYIIRPLAALLTNITFNAYIDRMQKKKWLVLFCFIRAGLVGLLMFNQDFWLVYSAVFLIQVCSSIYDPLSLSFVKLAIPRDRIKVFNSWKSLVSSGGFLIGPAIAGVLLSLGTPTIAVATNVIALALAGMIQLLLPNLGHIEREAQSKWSFIEDNKIGLRFLINYYTTHKKIIYMYMLISSLTILAAGLDSVEAAFSLDVLLMSEKEYGLLISISGAGFVIGAMLNSVVVEKLSIKQLILIGGVLYVTGYLIFSTALTYFMASIGVFIISFALAYINTGFLTFIQLAFPENKIGQLTAALAIPNALMEMAIVAAVSGLGTLINIRVILIATELIMVLMVILLFRYSKILDNHAHKNTKRLVDNRSS